MSKLIYADPPWKIAKSIRKSRPNQKKSLDYNTIDLDEIKNILKNNDGDILFMWTIDKYLLKLNKLEKNWI